MDARRGARVRQERRPSLRASVRETARHGSGAAWLDKRYPGSFPPRDSRWDDLKWLRRELLAAAKARRAGDPLAAERHLMPPLVIWAFELGRHLPNGVKQRGG